MGFWDCGALLIRISSPGLFDIVLNLIAILPLLNFGRKVLMEKSDTWPDWHPGQERR
jgi:hypothetical protein